VTTPLISMINSYDYDSPILKSTNRDASLLVVWWPYLFSIQNSSCVTICQPCDELQWFDGTVWNVRRQHFFSVITNSFLLKWLYVNIINDSLSGRHDYRVHTHTHTHTQPAFVCTPTFPLTE
jgi:hypothetical protein